MLLFGDVCLFGCVGCWVERRGEMLPEVIHGSVFHEILLRDKPLVPFPKRPRSTFGGILCLLPTTPIR